MVRTVRDSRGLLAALLLAGIIPLILGTGCALNPSDDGGNNGGGGGGGTGGTLDRTTTTKLVTAYLPAAYSQMDSIAYEAALDDAYLFELIPEEVDPNDPNPWWEKSEELMIAGNMFNARYNEAGQRVDRIRLTMDERSNVVDNTNYPDKPPTETWYKITALVDLLVVVEDPLDPEGVINFIVSSDQIFTVKPDADVDTLWSVYKQVDQEPIN